VRRWLIDLWLDLFGDVRKRMYRPMNVQNEESVKLCDADASVYNLRTRCSLPKGHVQSLEDWHEGKAETVASVKTNVFEQIQTGTEVLRWRPNRYELPDKLAREALEEDLGLLQAEKTDD
jgi:hypothetical protein